MAGAVAGARITARNMEKEASTIKSSENMAAHWERPVCQVARHHIHSFPCLWPYLELHFHILHLTATPMDSTREQEFNNNGSRNGKE